MPFTLWVTEKINIHCVYATCSVSVRHAWIVKASWITMCAAYTNVISLVSVRSQLTGGLLIYHHGPFERGIDC